MDAGAEGDVAVGVAAEVELVGVFEVALVAVGRGEAGEEHLAAADWIAAEFGVGAGVAGLGDLREGNVAE